MIELTDIVIYVSKNPGSNVGYGSVQFNNFVWTRIGIVKSRDGRLFVSWPQYRKTDGTFLKEIWFSNGDEKTSRQKLGELEEFILAKFAEKMGVTSQPAKKGPLVSINVTAEEDDVPFTMNNLADETFEDEDDQIFNNAIFKGK